MATPAACIFAVVGGLSSGGGMGKAAGAGAAGDCDGDCDDGRQCRNRGWWFGKRKGNWPRPKFSACLPVGPSGVRARVCVLAPGMGFLGRDGMVSEKSLAPALGIGMI